VHEVVPKPARAEPFLSQFIVVSRACDFKSAQAGIEWRHNFDVPSNPSSTGLGAYFRRITAERTCGGRLSYTTWKLDIVAPGFGLSALQELARYYVGLTQAWTHPDATIAVELPTQDTTRKGDFGELITACLFSHRLGYEVPFQKLEFMRPARTATVHGPDVSALTLGREPTPEPVLVESKLRPVISPGATSFRLGARHSVSCVCTRRARSTSLCRLRSYSLSSPRHPGHTQSTTSRR
jgi:hypothetical protein